LEYSGKNLGLMEFSSWIKHIIFFSMLANLYFPWGIATEFNFGAIILGIVVYFIKIVIIAIAITFLESAISKLRLFRVPNLLGIAFVIALIAVLLYYLL
jgi:formate hydrogenlyase subunit 4